MNSKYNKMLFKFLFSVVLVFWFQLMKTLVKPTLKLNLICHLKFE